MAVERIIEVAGNHRVVVENGDLLPWDDILGMVAWAESDSVPGEFIWIVDEQYGQLAFVFTDDTAAFMFKMTFL